ncbi:histone deacetylase 15-like isoform X2 [Typha latifolia]|uniref:histone deacetylase 15-like isoform X2 n=1 Tax=Typha latifolia TaxID=4733 RepID=UPI003C2CA22B
MESETLHNGSQKGRNFSRENKVRSEIHQAPCESSFSCPYECNKRSSPDGINGTLYPNERNLEERLLEEKNDGHCNPSTIHSDIASTYETCNSAPNLRSIGNADENACLHDKNESCKACECVQPQNCQRTHNGSTLEDLYLQDVYDDEDDEDSDWEPVNHFVIKKWFCSNCTMSNFYDVSHCDVCGEPRESELSGYDVFQSLVGKEACVSVDADAVCNYHASSSKTCTAIGFDERMLLHCEVEMKSHPHPERPDRLRAIAASLVAAGIFPAKCSLIPAREITREELLMVHSSDHIEAVEQTKNMLYSYFTSDTYANEYSACAARLAAGLCADLASSIMSGCTRNGFAMVRPPGHHAGVKQAMGFCLHNNAAVAALAAQRAGAKKVLILDWDVHHGNGTQEIFEGNKSVLYISLHRHEGGSFYPGTGAAEEVGSMDAQGYSVNIPWSCGGVGDNDYIFAFQHVVIPIALEFAPDITIISAGFDAARGDPLGCCDITPAGYAQMAHMLSAFAEGKMLVILEGGYNLHSISSSATAVVKVLLGESPNYDMINVLPSKAGLQTVLQVLRIQLKFWPSLESCYALLQSQWGLISSNNRNHLKKRKRLVGPFWWKWGSKRLVYELLYEGLHRKRSSTHDCKESVDLTPNLDDAGS